MWPEGPLHSMIHIWAQGRHFHWMILKMLLDLTQCISLPLCLPNQTVRISWKLTNQCPPHQHSWGIPSNIVKVYMIIYSSWWGRLWLSIFENATKKPYWHEQKRAKGLWFVFPQNSVVQANAYMNHGMERTSEWTHSFSGPQTNTTLRQKSYTYRGTSSGLSTAQSQHSTSLVPHDQ